MALSYCLVKLDVEERELLPTLLLQHLIKDGSVEVIHGVTRLQQEVVPHGLEVFQQPRSPRGKTDKILSFKKRNQWVISKGATAFTRTCTPKSFTKLVKADTLTGVQYLLTFSRRNYVEVLIVAYHTKMNSKE